MKIEDFNSGVFIPQFQYKSFLPEKINHEWSWDDPTINVLLEKATHLLGELNAFSLIVPDVDLFIQMHIIKEANTSSRIEGTKTEIDDALLEAAEVSPEKRDDWQEVKNYVQSINFAVNELKTLPISTRLLRKTHEILLQGVRGSSKMPGEYRKSQNWIGGSNLTDAVFIPPHANDVAALMGDLENFMHNETIAVPHLIRVAVSHYQFETIHPFLDGNGRIGRLLITLYMVGKGLLAKPSLYLSAFFERHRNSYYDALSRVREANDLGHWIKFFLNGVIETAGNGRDTFSEILKLRNRIDDRIIGLGRGAQNAKKLVSFLYTKPIVTAAQVSHHLKVSPKTAFTLIEKLMALGILAESTGKQRNRLFVFTAYLNLFMDKKL